jgi:carboxypeptidase Q
MRQTPLANLVRQAVDNSKSWRPGFSLGFGSLMLAAVCAAALSAGASQADAADTIARIRDEGLNHSQVMETLGYLTEAIGPRLTGSPNLKRANEWTRDKLTSWGLTNAHLEAWGPFGRGWSLQRFSAQLVEPQVLPLIAYPNAWTPGLPDPVTADVVYFDGSTNAQQQCRGKLAGAIVLNGPPRELKAHFEPLAERMEATNLLEYANAPEPGRVGSRTRGPGGRRGRSAAAGTNQPAASLESRRAAFAARARSQSRALAFITKEKAALVVNGSSLGDGGAVFVAAAVVPRPDDAPPGSFTNLPRPWNTNAPVIPPQITLAAEDYNRMVRMIQQGEKLRMAVDLQVRFHDADLMAYNTVAEIPGTDLREQVVMLGAHLDSWHAGTGATDNGAGVAAVMEAVRIIKALDLKPRRTIRVALWTGEEQGILGSKAYVAQHFGYFTNVSEAETLRAPKEAGGAAAEAVVSAGRLSDGRRLVRLNEYEKLSAYFNLDNGNGRIRGVFMEGNEAVRALFRNWLEPFRDLDAQTLTLSRTGSTDHTSFDAIGLPGFQFIQDPLEYRSRTHHSNEDVLDRIQPEDLKQCAVILAAFAYDAAMADALLPRKPLN